MQVLDACACFYVFVPVFVHVHVHVQLALNKVCGVRAERMQRACMHSLNVHTYA